MAVRGGVLTFTLKKEGRFAKISISDTGLGIDETNIKNLFKPFFTMSKDNQGTGLGLAIAQSIVQEMGGNYSRV